MSHLTRRDLLKTALAASAGLVAADALPFSATADASANTAEAALHSTQLPTSPRQRLLLDFGWRFQLGHANDPAKDFGLGERRRELQFAKSGGFLPVTRSDFNDSSWRSVDLPHDWAVELPFKEAPLLPHHGAKPVGREYPETSIGWYRRLFTLASADAGQRITIEFDGIFRDAMVMFNGHYIGENFSGYVPFQFDLTDFANFGDKNVLVVRVDATLGEGWFYEGAGIYRHVWLTKTDPLHVAQWGTFVRSEVREDAATIVISTEVENESEKARNCRVISRIVNPDDKVIATTQSKPATLAAWGSQTFESQAVVKHPLLWSIEAPQLYRVITTLESDSMVTDRDETTFGIRTIRFEPDKGFFLNEKPVKLKGSCNHQDHAGVGSALPDRLQYYRIERLKNMGSNAYRSSHNPPTPELLEACDRLGMLVMDETRMMSSNPEGLSELERLIRRDRNHPSVVIWSLGNEEREQGTERGARIAATMKRLARKLDPTRPVTIAVNGAWGKGVTSVVDVQGFNYAGAGGGVNLAKNIDEFHAKFPKLPTVGSETASSFFTRGIYVNDKEKGYVSAYDVNFPRYASGTEDWWKVYDERVFLAGGFFWTGFDYRGEPSPYAWPCISSHFGALDTCGFPKDIFYYYQSWWSSEPVLHLFPHWNWSGKEGQEIDVWCYSNLDSVELLLNGASLGSQKVERNSHVQWRLRYAPGVIEARGSKNGRVVLTERHETTGAPARLVLRPDRQKIFADGEDLAVIAVEVLDAKARFVPTAGNEISFKATGAGRLIGLGNGDPSCHEPDKPASPIEGKRSAFNGLCMLFVQATKQAGEIRIEATSSGLENATVAVNAEPAKLRPSI
ncbi:MAG TPA: beta-galactosidase GalA [Pyrinomonadaceae bacterium]